MRLLYITNDLNVRGGVERILSDCVNHLVQNCDYQIYIATVSDRTTSAYEYDERVVILSLGAKHSHAKFIGRLADMIYFGKALHALITEVKPDVVIKVQTSGYSWVVPMVCSSVPKVLWVHTSKMGLTTTMDHNQSRWFNRLYWHICPHLMERYDKTVLLTEEDSRDWGLKNASVIGNFTNYEHDSNHTSTLREKHAICIARYDYFKRLDLLIDIWQQVQAEHPDWTLDIYGGHGDDRERIENLVQTKNLAGCIVLHDATDRIDEKLLASSVFCFTSQFEGFGLVLIEAMQFGLPVVAFSTVGVNSIVNDGHNGYLIPFGDTQTYAKRLNALLSSYDLRKRMGDHAKESLTPFSKAEIMKKWNRLFEELKKE